MSGYINKVILIGNVGNEPEIRRMPDGSPVASFSLATTETWRDRNSGERRERTEWHRIVIYSEALAKLCEQYVHKGSRLYLEGALRTRKWTDQGGQERMITEVVLQGFTGNLTFLDARPSSSGGFSGNKTERTPSKAGASSPPQNSPQTTTSSEIPFGDLEDDIPF